MNSRGVLLAAVLVSATTTVAADCNPWPERLVIQYDVAASRGMLVLQGESTLTFTHEGNSYSAVTDLNASGLVTARSESRGSVVGAMLKPASYAESGSRRTEARASFDWAAQRVTFADGSTALAPSSLQDRASMLMQLARSARARPEAAAIAFPVASLRRISSFRFERRGAEALDTEAGRLDTIRYERLDASDGDRFEVWLAPASCWAPVRVRLRDHRGQDIDQRVKEIRVG